MARVGRAAVAHHEAGHVVAALHLGWTVTEVVVDTFQDGWTDAEPPVDREKDWQEHVIVLLAGGAAEAALGLGSEVTGNAADEREDAQRLCRLQLGETVGDERLRELQARAERIVEHRKGAMEVVVTEMMGRRSLAAEELTRLLRPVVPDLIA